MELGIKEIATVLVASGLLDWFWDKFRGKKSKREAKIIAKQEADKLEEKIRTSLSELGKAGDRVAKKMDEFATPESVKSEVTGAFHTIGRALRITKAPTDHDEIKKPGV